MKIIVSAETPKKVKLGEFTDAHYASAFVEAILKSSSECVKIIVETEND